MSVISKGIYKGKQVECKTIWDKMERANKMLVVAGLQELLIQEGECARSSCFRVRGDGDGDGEGGGGGAGIATGSQEVEHALIPCILPPLKLIRRASCERLCLFSPFPIFFFLFSLGEVWSPPFLHGLSVACSQFVLLAAAVVVSFGGVLGTRESSLSV